MATKPPVEVPQGAIRLNTDSQKLEFYAQDQWWEMATGESSPISARGFFQGGATGTSGGNHIEYVTITTIGDYTDFGDLPTAETSSGAAGASFTRGIHGGGAATSAPWAAKNHISSWIMATQGNGVDWGDLTRVSYRIAAGNAGDNTRVCFMGGINPGKVDTIDYVTIESSGGATDFGNLSATWENAACGSNPTRAVYGGGNTGSTPRTNQMEYITIQSTGNANDFGDLTDGRSALGGVSNSVRFFAAGGASPSLVNIIDSVNISSLGNAIDWGDLTDSYSNLCGVNSQVRGLWGGGYKPGGNLSLISYFDLTSRGDAALFGDLSGAGTGMRTASNCHGGLR
tara:strand:+ start:1103 stop:2128 length:1026 start_codon:yes stop_codon:yes gene_type:complete